MNYWCGLDANRYCDTSCSFWKNCHNKPFTEIKLRKKTPSKRRSKVEMFAEALCEEFVGGEYDGEGVREIILDVLEEYR